MTISEGFERFRWSWHARLQNHNVGFNLLASYLEIKESTRSIVAAEGPAGSFGTDNYSSQKIDPTSFGRGINEDFGTRTTFYDI